MSIKFRKFSPEFRDEAAKMVVETSRPIADVARELGINETSLVTIQVSVAMDLRR